MTTKDAIEAADALAESGAPAAALRVLAGETAMLVIDKPGAYEISAADYHRDPCPAPSLSAGIAHELLRCSPAHARWKHPKMRPPEYEEDAAERLDVGTALHAYLLEGESGFAIVQAPDFRTKSAREQRDAARLAGKVPLLADRWAGVQAMVEAVRRQLAAHEAPIPFTNGQPEQTLVWREGEVYCRARLDWLHDDRRTIDDLKSTGASSEPHDWTRGPLFSGGYDIQAAFYRRGVKALFGVEAEFRFVVVETSPPYGVSVIGLGPDVEHLGARKVERAIETWRACLATGIWPGYPTRTCWADLPPWEEARFIEREMLMGVRA